MRLSHSEELDLIVFFLLLYFYLGIIGDTDVFYLYRHVAKKALNIPAPFCLIIICNLVGSACLTVKGPSLHQIPRRRPLFRLHKQGGFCVLLSIENHDKWVCVCEDLLDAALFPRGFLLSISYIQDHTKPPFNKDMIPAKIDINRSGLNFHCEKKNRQIVRKNRQCFLLRNTHLGRFAVPENSILTGWPYTCNVLKTKFRKNVLS